MTQSLERPILITGAAGFIGYHLSKRLLAEGCCIVGFDCVNAYYDPSLKRARLDDLSRDANFSFVEGDLADYAQLEAVFERVRPAYVVNLAAQAGVRYSIENPRAYIESNVVGFFNLLEAARKYPVKHLLYASSSSVYGNRKDAAFSVCDRVDTPVSLYAATKKSDELMAYAYSKLYDIPATALRFFTVYGPLGRPDMAYYKFTKAIFSGATIDVYNNGDLMRDFTYIDDVIDCLTVMLQHAPQADENGAHHAIYNIGNQHPERLGHFIETLEAACGRKANKRYLPMQPGDVYVTAADISQTTRDFGFLPRTTIEEGLPRFVSWYRSFYGV